MTLVSTSSNKKWICYKRIYKGPISSFVVPITGNIKFKILWSHFFFAETNCQVKMLFFSFFKTLVDQEVVVELKNDIEIKGVLKSVDQYLNLKLDNISCTNETKYPHLTSVKNLFIRGSTVRYVRINPNAVDCTLLQDASRRGMFLLESFACDNDRYHFQDFRRWGMFKLLNY